MAAMSRSNWPTNLFRGILRRIDYTPQPAIATAQVCAFDPQATSRDAPASVATSRRQVHRKNGLVTLHALELRDATLRPRCRCAWQGYRSPRDLGSASRGAFFCPARPSSVSARWFRGYGYPDSLNAPQRHRAPGHWAHPRGGVDGRGAHALKFSAKGATPHHTICLPRSCSECARSW